MTLLYQQPESKIRAKDTIYVIPVLPTKPAKKKAKEKPPTAATERIL